MKAQEFRVDNFISTLSPFRIVRIFFFFVSEIENNENDKVNPAFDRNFYLPFFFFNRLKFYCEVKAELTCLFYDFTIINDTTIINIIITNFSRRLRQIRTNEQTND